MNYVLGTCFTCGRITARKFLRVKKLSDNVPTGKGEKILVCTVCEQKLQLPKGIEDWNSNLSI
jgi:hypothetical protein